ncbi:MAG: hypothetical protein ACNA8H_16570, partial [Anaerolineales bacterium]
GPRIFNNDGDLGRHITIGNYIIDNRTIPTEDIFSHTMAGERLTPHEWLAQVAFALVHRMLGLDGVVLFSALLIAVTFTICYRQCQHRSGLVLVSLGFAILAAATASLHWLARPHLFTLLFVVLWVGILERIRRGETQRWYMLPILMLFWANTHGAFIAGFVIWGIYLVGDMGQTWLNPGRQRSPIPGEAVEDLDSIASERSFTPGFKSYLAGGLVSLVVTSLNPAGLHLWATTFGFLRSRYLVSHTVEYMPPNFHNISTWPFMLMIVLSLLLLGFKSGFKPASTQASVVHILLLSAWTAMGLYSARNIPIYALLVAPILAEILGNNLRVGLKSSWFVKFNRRLSTVEASLRGGVWSILGVIFITLALMGGARLDYDQQGNRYDPTVFPVQAVDWLEGNPLEGNGFNYFPWGGYLLYRSWPERTVFIDGQTDFYGEALTRQYEQVITFSGNWEAILDQYQVEWVIMPTGSALVRALNSDPNWGVVYQDPTTAIFIKR